jgi:hypothetical protein
MDNEEYSDAFEEEIDDEMKELLTKVMNHKVIDGDVYVSVKGVKALIDIWVDSVEDAARNGQTCQHGVIMADSILTNIDVVMDCCTYVNAGSIVPDTIPDDIMGA